MKNQIRTMSKHDWIIILFSMLIATATANAQDTVYIANSGSNVTITYKGSVKSVPRSLISANKIVSPILPTQVSIFNGASQVDSWTFNFYRFKVNQTAITNVDSFVPAINNLNTAMVVSYKLLKDIQIVSALPANPDPTVTYLVGAQTTISITGLNGNTDGYYRIQGTTINAGSADTHTMRFNSVSTNVYDSRYSYVGAASSTGSNLQTHIFIAPNNGANSLTMFDINIDPVTGKNRTVQGVANVFGANQITAPLYPTFGGLWRDNSTNITSIQLGYASISNGYAVGTRIRVYSLQQ